VTGTRRIIALHDDDQNVPAEISEYERVGGTAVNSGDALFGNFYVCAGERSRPGWMQHVRLLRTKDLMFRGKPFPLK
jgi:hypothetical protein